MLFPKFRCYHGEKRLLPLSCRDSTCPRLQQNIFSIRFIFAQTVNVSYPTSRLRSKQIVFEKPTHIMSLKRMRCGMHPKISCVYHDLLFQVHVSSRLRNQGKLMLQNTTFAALNAKTFHPVSSGLCKSKYAVRTSHSEVIMNTSTTVLCCRVYNFRRSDSLCKLRKDSLLRSDRCEMNNSRRRCVQFFNSFK